MSSSIFNRWRFYAVIAAKLANPIICEKERKLKLLNKLEYALKK
jgi:hypothetical protein